MIYPCIICFLYTNIIRRFTHYATAASREIAFIYKKLYRAVWWRITTNVFGCITEKNGRLFCCIATYFRGCNGIGDLLTRQARNFIYTEFLLVIVYLLFDLFVWYIHRETDWTTILFYSITLHWKVVGAPQMNSQQSLFILSFFSCPSWAGHSLVLSSHLFFCLPLFLFPNCAL